MTTTPQQPSLPVPDPVDWRESIAAAHQSLAPIPPATQPTRAAVRRAISTAYYAAFHALMESNASCFVGQANNPLTTEAWSRVYRAATHHDIIARLNAERNALPPAAQRFADQLQLLQSARISADYVPTDASNLQNAIHWLNIAAAVVNDFMQLSREERSAIAVITILGHR